MIHANAPYGLRAVSPLGFKAAVRRDRKSASELMVRKLSVTAPPEDLGGSGASQPAGPIRFAITTASVDREGDSIALEGWELEHYRRNPVVLWGHDSREPPIGRAAKLFRDGDALKADVEFLGADVPVFGPRAEGIRRMCAAGFLFATSVGFRPLEWEESADEARGGGGWFPGIDFQRHELMEFSVVSIPCNPEALIEPDAALAEALGLPPPALVPPAADPERSARLRARRQRERLARIIA